MTINPEHKKILAVLAHPDDESFGMGGTLALYAEQGVEVDLICATRGEVGEASEEDLQGFETIGDMREAELRCAAAKLGISNVYLLGYRDSGMPGSENNRHPQALVAAPVEEVVGKVVHYMREFRPDVVLTFDPIGGYRHPDHIAIHNATVAAFDKAADPNYNDPLPPHQAEKLYFHTMPKTFIKFSVFMLRLMGKDPSKWGKNQDIDLESLVKVEFPVHARINYRPVEKRKDEAAFCHASQGGGRISRGPVGLIMRWFGAKDEFMRAYPPPSNGYVEKDLLEGIR